MQTLAQLISEIVVYLPTNIILFTWNNEEYLHQKVTVGINIVVLLINSGV